MAMLHGRKPRIIGLRPRTHFPVCSYRARLMQASRFRFHRNPLIRYSCAGKDISPSVGMRHPIAQ